MPDAAAPGKYPTSIFSSDLGNSHDPVRLGLGWGHTPPMTPPMPPARGYAIATGLVLLTIIYRGW